MISIGDTVVTKSGQSGKVLGVVAGVVHIGTKDKKVLPFRVFDVRAVDPADVIETGEDVVPAATAVDGSIPSRVDSVNSDDLVVPVNMTRDWLTGQTTESLKNILDASKDLSAPRKSKIRKEILAREKK